MGPHSRQLSDESFNCFLGFYLFKTRTRGTVGKAAGGKRRSVWFFQMLWCLITVYRLFVCMRARVPLCVCARACSRVIHSCGAPTDGGRRRSERLTAPRRLIGFDFRCPQRNPCGDGTICCLDGSDWFSTVFIFWGFFWGGTQTLLSVIWKNK